MKHTKLFLIVLLSFAATAFGQVAIKGKTVYTSAGDPIQDGVVLLEDGKIKAVGPASQVNIPSGYKVFEGAVVTPGLVDAHSVVGFAGYLNQNHDQDQLDRSKPIQPQLRAIDAYNPREYLVGWLREHGVTTVHTGHGPGALISGQTMIVKTTGNTVADSVMVPRAMLAMTLAGSARASGGKSPGTRAKMISMLRTQFIKAQEYKNKLEKAEEGKEPSRNLAMETLAASIGGDLPVMITVHREQDIHNALRLAEEFNLKLVLDGAAEAFLVTDHIKKAGVPVIIHPTMMRTFGEAENATMEAASLLDKAGIPVAFQSGFEGYVPKTRVVLFEAAVAAAYGLTMERALTIATLEAAKLLGVDDRVGSLETGKDGDVVIFNGDPFEYLTTVQHVFINGEHVSDVKR